MNPIVSIVMPAFNSRSYITDAIRSVQAQTREDWELLVVDGGSRDETPALVRAAAVQDSRIQLVPNPDDKGPAHARATGVRHARGKYVAFLDADDLWLPEKLAIQVEMMEQRGLDFSYTRYSAMSADGSEVSCPLSAYRRYGFWSALGRRGIGTLTVMVRRERLTEKILSTFGKSHGEEYLWWLLILREGVTAHLVPKDLARYRNTEGSLSKRRLRHQSTVWHTYRNEMGLSMPVAGILYASYVLDVAQRRVQTRLCTQLTQILKAKT